MTEAERDVLQVGSVIKHIAGSVYEITVITQTRITLDLKLIATTNVRGDSIGTAYYAYDADKLLSHSWQVVKSNVSRRYIYEELAVLLKMLEGSDANA